MSQNLQVVTAEPICSLLESSHSLHAIGAEPQREDLQPSGIVMQCDERKSRLEDARAVSGNIHLCMCASSETVSLIQGNSLIRTVQASNVCECFVRRYAHGSSGTVR